MYWSILSEDVSIPDWLKAEMPHTCSYCGKQLLSGRNENGRLTGLKCEDDYCPSKIASQLEFMLDLLGMKGYGFATCLQLVKQHKYKHPLEYVQVFENKPTVSLGDFLRCCCIQGIDGEWVTMAEKSNSYTLEELIQAYPHHEVLNENIEYIKYCIQFVKLKERKIPKKRSTVPIVIMITGTPIGYPTKEAFIAACNELLDGEFHVIHQKTKKQSGVNFLIREEGYTTRGKVEAAIKGGIPIVTSAEFVQLLQMLKEDSRREHK